VALARAVLLSPKIMLADEPTASLDDEAANQACALLVQTAQRCSANLVVATHDARVGSALAAMGQTAQRFQIGNLSKIGSLAISGVREAL
jgi:putative ABC transport system ATP-binding protein